MAAAFVFLGGVVSGMYLALGMGIHEQSKHIKQTRMHECFDSKYKLNELLKSKGEPYQSISDIYYECFRKQMPGSNPLIKSKINVTTVSDGDLMG